MKTAKIAIKQIARMSNYLKGMQADFNDGSLKRVAPSKNPVEKLEFAADMQSKNNEAEDDAIYICLENRESESDDSDSDFASNHFTSLNRSGKATSDKGGETQSLR